MQTGLIGKVAVTPAKAVDAARIQTRMPLLKGLAYWIKGIA